MTADHPESKSTASTSDNSVGNIKETIESILVAFILAFVFRAFVLEAFVIPTGSMAPTLLGAHMRFHCPDCGYQFDVNVSGEENGDDANIPNEANPLSNIYCPNCGYLVAPAQRQYPPYTQAVHYGDRILVLKYAYLLHPPQRWDVVVFKSPAAPKQFHYSQNYIKRLVGLPGEQVMVLDGDLYIRNSDQAPWTVQTKPRKVQEALWRLVYDNDFHPQTEKREGQPDWHQPWTADSGTGWNLNDKANPRIFHFDNSSGAASIHFDPHANATSQTFNEYLVYDIDVLHRSRGLSNEDDLADAVPDLKLVAYYQRLSGDGPMRLKLSRFEKVDHTFTAEISPDSVKLLHLSNGVQTQIGSTLKLSDLGISAHEPMLLELLNVDYRVTLRINGKEVLQTTPRDYHPDVSWLMDGWKSHHGTMPQASIEAEKQTATLTHLSLWRDIYYTSMRKDINVPLPQGTPENPAKLKSGEYFVMGDNSLVSSDARYWTDKIDLPHEGLEVDQGRVPEQFMLGKAIFVYWPAGYRPFDPGGPAIIPNFGDMRWIH